MRHWCRSRMMTWALVILLSTVGSSESQTITGTIDGVVRDQSGDPMPGVQIVAKSPSLIQKDLAVRSDAQGYYRLPALPPGTCAPVRSVLKGRSFVALCGTSSVLRAFRAIT